MERGMDWRGRVGPLTEKRACQILLVGNRDPARVGRLVRRAGSAVAALEGDWLPPGGTMDEVLRALDCELKLVDALGLELLSPEDKGWPAALASAYQPPLLLYVRGRLPDWSSHPGLALVGSRYGAAYGERVAARLAAYWTDLGGAVVSGGALGVDTAAHQAAVARGGQTVAVLATGVDRPHPRTNRTLFAQMCERGALCSELPTRSRPLPRNFPWRNRLIAGLSFAVVVAQAAAKSGALHTATFALKCGRKLFTVPTSLDDEACAGSLDLLVQGVPALARTEQLANLFASATGESPQCLEPVAVPDRLVVTLAEVETSARKVLLALEKGGLHVDDLLRATNMGQASLSLALLDLELKNWVVKEAGNRYSCTVRLER
jgi:DNA processing protein